MLPRLSVAIGLACLAVLGVVAPFACSSSSRRDQWYGTNEGADYQPEAGVFTGDGGDLSSEAGSVEAGSDEVTSPDSQTSPDTVAPDAAAQLDADTEADAPAEADADTVP